MGLKIITVVIVVQAILQNIIQFVILNDNSAISGKSKGLRARNKEEE